MEMYIFLPCKIVVLYFTYRFLHLIRDIESKIILYLIQMCFMRRKLNKSTKKIQTYTILTMQNYIFGTLHLFITLNNIYGVNSSY